MHQRSTRGKKGNGHQFIHNLTLVTDRQGARRGRGGEVAWDGSPLDLRTRTGNLKSSVSDLINKYLKIIIKIRSKK